MCTDDTYRGHDDQAGEVCMRSRADLNQVLEVLELQVFENLPRYSPQAQAFPRLWLRESTILLRLALAAKSVLACQWRTNVVQGPFLCYCHHTPDNAAKILPTRILVRAQSQRHGSDKRNASCQKETCQDDACLSATLGPRDKSCVCIDPTSSIGFCRR